MSQIRIHTCNEQDRDRWDCFVRGNAHCTNYHLWAWREVFQKVFGWTAIYLLAEEGGEIRGILPLISQKCLLRTYLSSMPHLNGGGIVADSSEIEHALLASAIEAAQKTGVTYLELRQIAPHALPLVPRQDKIGATLLIEKESEARLRALDKKTRNLVRKSLTFGMTAEFGGAELLNDFYAVYRHNMHDLGSPSYAMDFFSEILKHFPKEAQVCIVRRGKEVVSGAFLMGFRHKLEVAWASSYREFLSLKPNMFLYWNILEFAAAHGYEVLDFGRSSRGSSTFEFKAQWGATPSDLHWGYWLNEDASLPTTRQGGMQLASQIWQKLPLAVTNVLGPKLVRHIPGV